MHRVMTESPASACCSRCARRRRRPAASMRILALIGKAPQTESLGGGGPRRHPTDFATQTVAVHLGVRRGTGPAVVVRGDLKVPVSGSARGMVGPPDGPAL